MVTFAVGRQQTGYFSKWFEHIAEVKLSNRLKKLIFIASTIGLIKNEKSPEQKLLDKVNDVFSIAKGSAGIGLPMAAKGLIWRDICDRPIGEINGEPIYATCIDKREFTSEERNNLIQFFIDRAPKWLRYDTEQVMKSDLEKIINNLPALR